LGLRVDGERSVDLDVLGSLGQDHADLGLVNSHVVVDVVLSSNNMVRE
jgi:hypothetical protein